MLTQLKAIEKKGKLTRLSTYPLHYLLDIPSEITEEVSNR
jgi:hypothetical protein